MWEAGHSFWMFGLGNCPSDSMMYYKTCSTRPSPRWSFEFLQYFTQHKLSTSSWGVCSMFWDTCNMCRFVQSWRSCNAWPASHKHSCCMLATKHVTVCPVYVWLSTRSELDYPCPVYRVQSMTKEGVSQNSSLYSISAECQEPIYFIMSSSWHAEHD